MADTTSISVGTMHHGQLRESHEAGAAAESAEVMVESSANAFLQQVCLLHGPWCHLTPALDTI